MSPDTVLEPAIAIGPRPQRARILVIDDDVSQAEVLAHRLQKQGFRTDLAHTAEQGLKRVDERMPDLVILDIGLPDKSGWDVCQQLTDNAETCRIPVIFLSGMDRPDIIRRCRAAGGRYFVRKPYDPDALLLLAESALAQ